MEALVADLARQLFGDVGPVAPVLYDSGSPATGGLWRVRGRDRSIFVKLIQHIRHWPKLELVPPALRDDFVARFPWRQELAVWDEPFAGHLPAGLRVPELYQLSDLGDDRTLIWMEDVDALDETQWTVTTFERPSGNA